LQRFCVAVHNKNLWPVFWILPQLMN